MSQLVAVRQHRPMAVWGGRTGQRVFEFDFMKINWIIIIAGIFFISFTPVKAGLLGNIANVLNNVASGTKDTDKQSDALPQASDVGKPADGKPYYVKSDKSERIPLPFEQIFAGEMSGYYKVSGAWYFWRNDHFFNYITQKKEIRWELSISDSSEFVEQSGNFIMFAFDPSSMTSTNVPSQMFLQLKSAQESWWKSSKENKGENRSLTDPFGKYLEAVYMFAILKSDPKTVNVKVYKTIEDSDTIDTVKKKFSEDSTVSILIDTNQLDAVEFSSSYLGDPCQGVVYFSKRSGRVTEVVLASSESVEQEKFVAESVKTELGKSDVDRTRDELKEMNKTTDEKMAGQAGNLNAVVRAMNIKEIGKKWSSVVNEKYPTGYSDDCRLKYDVDSEHASIHIIDVARAAGNQMLDAQSEFKKNCDDVESEAKKINASKSDL